MISRSGFWKKQKHYLNKMTLKELFAAYFQHYTIQTYLVIGIVCSIVALNTITAIAPNLAVIAFAILAYPLAWYLLHRFVLHGKFLFRSPLTAKVWKRIHYDHHQDPHDLDVLFGALYTTLPTIALVTMPVGYLFDGIGGAMTGLATGVFTTCVYEFFHCIQHLSYKPRNKWVKEIKRLHMTHHFHNENGNYGITNYLWDRLFGSFYPDTATVTKSPTVHNLGYTAAMAEIYPWVAEASGGLGPDNPRARRQSNTS